jgi:3-hydroxyacyl-CoA dehydrogenase
LGEVRGKYKSLPSPGGGASLNGADLMQQSVQEKDKLKEELLSEIEEPPAFTLF